MLAMATARRVPRLRWPTYRPVGTAIAAAIATAIAESWRWYRSCWAMPGPKATSLQLAGVKIHSRPSIRSFIPVSPAA